MAIGWLNRRTSWPVGLMPLILSPWYHSTSRNCNHCCHGATKTVPQIPFCEPQSFSAFLQQHLYLPFLFYHFLSICLLIVLFKSAILSLLLVHCCPFLYLGSSGTFMTPLVMSIRHKYARHKYARRTWKMHKIGGSGSVHPSPKRPDLSTFFLLAKNWTFLTLFYGLNFGQCFHLNIWGLHMAEFTQTDNKERRNMPGIWYIHVSRTHFNPKILLQ